MTAEPTAHWDTYYSSGEVPKLPSQFAVFVLNEYPETQSVIDLGCGSGRDALFFARQGARVVGVDKSPAALSLCESSRRDPQNPTFVLASIDQPDCVDALRAALDAPSAPLVLYARFFLHALNEAEEARLLDVAGQLLSAHEGVFALEFRTHRDRGQAKATPDHYRRFVDPDQFLLRASAAGFEVAYKVEGFGLAKYKQDDAHVARVILKRERVLE